MKHAVRMLSTLWILLAFTLSSQAAAVLKEGKQYTRLAQPIADAPPVVEFFSFYCPACSSFLEPYRVSESINKQLPEGIKTEKYHVSAMGPMGKALTEAWSIAKALGVEDRVERPLFEAVLQQQAIRSEADIRQVFIRAGVEAEKYDAARHSFMVKVLTARQEQAATAYDVTGTPAFYINGKFMIRNNGIQDQSVDGYGREFADVVRQLLNQ